MPDATRVIAVLVQDTEGYQPLAWPTRADRVAIDDDGVRARRDDARLEVVVEDRYGDGRFPAGPAGSPVGDCPDCGETLVRSGGRVACTDCDADYGLSGRRLARDRL